MATILDNLKVINPYPVPASVIQGAAIKNGLDIESELDREVMLSKEYNLCRADILSWLSYAPNISQGGQSYSFSEDQRRQFQYEAESIRCEYQLTGKPRYGYKGSKL